MLLVGNADLHSLQMRLLAELLGDEDQVESVNDPIAIRVWGGCTESVGDLNEIQDVDTPIVVDIGEAWGLEVDFAIEIGE